MRESHARCVRLGRSGDYFEIVTVLNSILSSWLYFSISIIINSLFLALAISSICILLTVLLSFICRLSLCTSFSPSLSLSLFCVPVCTRTVLSLTTLCYYWLFIVHLLYYSFVLFLASAFLPRSTTFSFSQSHRSAYKSQLTTPHCQPTILLPPSYHFHRLLVVYSHSLSFRGFFLLSFVLLSGDIELNPGPSAFTLCSLNVCSILHPLYSAALSDLIDTHNPDLFCLAETWIKLPPLLNFLTAHLHTTP